MKKILIVMADRDRKNNTPVEQTVTDTVTPTSAPPASPSGWTDRAGWRTGQPRFVATTRLTSHATALAARDEAPR